MLQSLYKYIITDKTHRSLRRRLPDTLAEEYAALGLSPRERMTRRFELLTAQETPVILPNERICFTRTIENLPPIFTDTEWADIRSRHFIHELGYHSNVCPDYEKVTRDGLLSLREKADEYGRRVIDSLLSLVARYRDAAASVGRGDIAAVLERVPAYGARSFREALQSFRILHFALWLEGDYHNTIGRFDQYMYPYLVRVLESGTLSRQEAQELLEEFFLSFNRDSDLYVGVQQGDNGQSMMLGGMTREGRDGFNELSEMCLTASGKLKLIDPKINVRVDKNTPQRIYTLCSELTRAGLGFPQYANDDVVIPGLIKLGYEEGDARDYTVAACWEFIIPYVGGDVANIAALSFPKIIDTCVRRDLADCVSMEEFLSAVREEIRSECDVIRAGVKHLWFIPSPFLSLLMDYEDELPKYRNFGVHGVGVSNAADSLTAISRYVFGDGSLSPERLVRAVDSDFSGEEELLHKLRYETPKVGSDEDEPDDFLCLFLDSFADALEGHKNDCGGIWRAGTGSAMYYLWHAAVLGASPDGRRMGEPFAANYSVSLFARPDGPFSLIRSMSKPDLSRVINGGPVTLEFHNSIFSTPEAVEQVGQFVKAFIDMGGHQLQLNAVNADTLRDAQAHPEKYPRLIVRIWGWSAYFIELDRAYQDHVIMRQEYLL
ncbi:MAG: pyruvate formate lyase family protein [Eubacteriales bacterium]